jgi:dienelactone hydrolase
MTRTGDADRFSRPQDPRPPYPYTVRDVTFRSETAGITLAGTLTHPDGEGPFPGVVLVTGSGPQNRDAEVFDHRPFLVWADALTRAGFAVLRYDDRGTAQSEGDFDGSTSKDFAGDAESARSYLMSLSVVDPERVGLLGHSEGSIVSVMVASGEMPGSTPTSPEVAFVVSLAGPAVPGHEVLVAQSAAFLRASGVNEDAIALSSSTNHQAYAAVMEGGDTPEAREKVSGILAGAGLNAAQIEAQLPVLFSPWYMHFLAYDPAQAIARLKCPVLALFGSLDFQVLATQNKEPFEAALRQAPTQRYRVELLEGKNHLFQTATTGLLDEYGKIEQTISPEAIELVTSWLVSEMM